MVTGFNLVIQLFAEFINIVFMIGGYKLAKLAWKKQKEYYENGGSNDVGYRETIAWVMTFGVGLIVAYFFPLKFHDVFCDVIDYSFRAGVLVKVAQIVLAVQMLFVVLFAPKIIIPIGRFVILFIMPPCLIYGHFFQ